MKTWTMRRFLLPQHIYKNTYSCIDESMSVDDVKTLLGLIDDLCIVFGRCWCMVEARLVRQCIYIWNLGFQFSINLLVSACGLESGPQANDMINPKHEVGQGYESKIRLVSVWGSLWHSNLKDQLGPLCFLINDVTQKVWANDRWHKCLTLSMRSTQDTRSTKIMILGQAWPHASPRSSLDLMSWD